MRGENQSREDISRNRHEIHEQLLCRPSAKSGQVLVRTQQANTPARCGWNADRAQPFLVIATRDASSISDDRQKKADRFWSAPRKRTPRPDAAGMPIAHSHFL